VENYESYKNLESTEKIVLATIDPAKRLIGFIHDLGFIYKLNNFNISLILSIKDSGIPLTQVYSYVDLVEGSYFNDKENSTLYIYADGGVNPNSLFLVLLFRLFFSNVPIELPNDLDNGFEVEWLPYILQTSDFEVELDNENQQGFAIEGTGSINLANIQEYWKPIFDKITFENKEVNIYSYHRSLDPTEAKLLFRGFIQKKSWSPKSVNLSLKDIISELKNEFVLPSIEDYSGAVVPNNLLLAKQRVVYGYVNGHVPTPIDQIVQGYEGTGIISFEFDSLIVTGIGTSFLSELSPDDELFLDGIDDKFSIAKINSDTELELSSEFEFGNINNSVFYIKPSLPKRYKNRVFLAAGHATREPESVITEVVSLNFFEVSDDSDLIVGDRIEISGQSVNIRRVSSNKIKLRQNLLGTPTVGNVVKRPSISDVYINDLRLLDNSYNYDASTGVLQIDEDAEFRVAKIRLLLGTQITLTNGSRTVTGVGTSFTSQLKSSDWIRTQNQAEFFEVLQIISDTELELRTPSSYDSTNVGIYKAPEYYKEGSSVLSVNIIGKTKDGLKTGAFIKTSAEIVEDLLINANLGDLIDTPSIIESKSLAPQRVGLVIPAKIGDKKTDNFRKIIGDISQATFGSLIQTRDYKLAFRVLSPKRKLDDLQLDEIDLISFSINSDSSKIIKTAVVNFDFKEYDFLAAGSSNLQARHTPLINEFLTQSILENTYNLRLVEESDADTMAERYALLLQLSRAKVTLKTKLKTMDLEALERVWLNHEKLYERIGTRLNKKVSGVQSINKNGFDVDLVIEDLSGAFSRCSIITENLAENFFDASENEHIINGYITDEYGMINNNADTYSINLIW
jgi:hypothetical protein